MKLKKKHFKRLKDIAVAVNEIVPGTGVRLDKLIAEIESVQKVKEEFSLIDIDQLRKDTVKEKVKIGPDSVANINNSRPSIQDKKKYKEYIMDRVYSQHRKDVENNIQKEGEAMVAASTGEGTYTEGLRKYLSDSTDWKPLEFGGSDFTKTVDASILKEEPNNGILEIKKGSEIEKFLDDALVLSNKDPKIGDVGYFWDDPCISAVFGKLDLVLESYPVKYQVTLNGDFVRNFPNFSKTPPELK